jgi:hypothetical protein
LLQQKRLDIKLVVEPQSSNTLATVSIDVCISNTIKGEWVIDEEEEGVKGEWEEEEGDILQREDLLFI